MLPHTFTGNFDPTNTKEAEAVFSVKYYDSPFTVKSSGITLYRYLIDNSNEPDFSGLTNLTLVDTLTASIVGFYSDEGAMLGFHETDNFALHYTGYFYASHTSGNLFYNFKTYGFGFLKVLVNDNRYIIGSASSFATLNTHEPISGSYQFTAGTWTKFDVYYYTKLGQAGFTLLWENAQTGVYIPVSAGIMTKTGSYLSSTTLSDVISIERNEENEEVQYLNFTVPLVASGSSNNGYYYNTYWDKYCHTTVDIALDKFKMISFEAGYQLNGADDTVQKFIGHIESFKPKRGKQNILQVDCLGFENFYKQSINLNYPNCYDYWNAEYAERHLSDTSPDGKGMPATFDGWQMDKVFKVLSIRAGIDPYLFVRKRQFRDSQSVLVNANYLIESTYPQSVILDVNLNYGNSEVINSDIGAIPDDEYIIKSNFGDYIYDYVNTITDVYGWKWGCHSYYDGAPFLKSNNNPFSIYDVNDFKYSGKPYGVTRSGSFTNQTDINTIAGTYIETNSTPFIIFYFKGSKANLVIVGGEDSGTEATIKSFSNDLTMLYFTGATTFQNNQVIIVETVAGEETATISSVAQPSIIELTSALSSKPVRNGYVRTATFKAELRRGLSTGGTLLQTTYHSCYFNNNYDRLILSTNYKSQTPTDIDTKRFYYDGIDPKTSTNPCLISIANNLSYDDYNLKVSRLTNTQAGTTNYMRIDALFAYDRNTSKISDIFYTGDSVVSGTVIQLEIEDSGVDLRNDTIVVGRRLGAEVPGSDYERVINPNNPTFQHIISRATDIASIYNPDVRNYVGYPRQTIQIAPEIASQPRANYWATNFINRYRYPKRFPSSFTTLGNPLMELDDCIAIKDEGTGTVETYDKFWITGIKETYDKKKYETTYTTTSYEPWESFTPRIHPNPEDFEDKPISNLKITNGGDGEADSENPSIETTTSAYDPYSYDAYGTQVTIKYDLNIDCWIKIDIVPTEKPDIVVATLLNPTGSTGNVGWMQQEVGKNYIVTWDGVDSFGDWNQYASETDTEPIGKQFFVHEGRKPTNGKGRFFVKFTMSRRNVSVSLVKFSTDSTLIDTTDNPTGYIYTKRANVSSIDFTYTPPTHLSGTIFPLSSSLIFTIPSLYYKFNYTDATSYEGYPMVAKLMISDNTALSNRWFRTIGTSTYYLGRQGLGLSMANERNHNNRKISLTISAVHFRIFKTIYPGHNTTVRVERFEPDDPIYHDGSFKVYSNFAKYLNFQASGFSYDYYKEVFSSDYLTNIQNANGSIYMGWYTLLKIDAIDKSGRRIKILTQNTDATFNNLINCEATWLVWLDDKQDENGDYDTVSCTSVATEPSISDYLVDITEKYYDLAGDNLFTHNRKGLPTLIPVFKVYPEKEFGY